MPQLVPVDHDPFAAPATQPQDYLSKMVEAQGADPGAMVGEGQPKLVPVDYDPFAQDQQTMPELPKKDISMLESGVRGAVHGGSMGFGDEAMGWLGSVGARVMRPDLFKDESFVDTYRQGRDIARGQEQDARQANPWTYGLSEVGGGIMTGAKMPLPKVSQGATAAGRIANAAAGGATAGGVYGFGDSNADITKGEFGKAAMDTATSAGIGALTGTLLQGGLEKYAKSRVPTPKSDEIKDMATQAYKTAEAKGGYLSDKFTNRFIDKTAEVLPQTEAGKIVAGENDVSKLVERLQGLKGRKLSLSEAQEIDETLGDIIDGMFESGRLTKQGKKVLDIQSEFRNMIDNASSMDIIGGREGFDALKEGRKLWSTSARMRDIEKIIARAEMTDNPATAIKTGFRTLSMNPKRMRGFSPEERKLIEKAAKSGIVSDGLRTFGSRLLPIITLGAGGGVGDAVLAKGAQMASHGAATKMQFGKANRVAEEIAKSLRPPVQAPQLINAGPQIRRLTSLDAILANQAGVRP